MKYTILYHSLGAQNEAERVVAVRVTVVRIRVEHS